MSNGKIPIVILNYLYQIEEYSVTSIFVTQHLAKSVDPDEMAHKSHLI